jgi:uncharacterized membrane protein YidH (DUF202 family)
MRTRLMPDVDWNWKGCPGRLGVTTGLSLILFGLVLVVVAAARFVRTERLLDDQEAHSPSGGRAEVLLSAALALIVVGCSIYLALG